MREQSPLAVGFREQRVEALRSYPAMQPAIDHHRGRARTITQAIDGFQGETPVGRRLVEVYPQPLPRVRGQRFAPDGLTRLCPAYADGVHTRGRAAKVVIERNDAMDFGARQVELGGDERYRRRWDISELGLNRVQHLNQRPRPPLEIRDDPSHGLTVL